MRMRLSLHLCSIAVSLAAVAASDKRPQLHHSPSLLLAKGPDVNEALEQSRKNSGAYQLKLSLTAGLGLFGGSAAVWAVPVLLDAKIASGSALTEEQLTTAASLCFAGWIVGGPSLLSLSDKVGRKVVLVWSGVLAACSLLLSSVASTEGIAMLAIARFAGGVALGGLGAGYTLALESEAPSLRSAMSTRLQTFFAVACALIAAFQGVVCEQWLHLPWRAEVGMLGALLLGLSLFVSVWSVESPLWLATKRPEKLAHAIATIARCNGYKTPPVAVDVSPASSGPSPSTTSQPRAPQQIDGQIEGLFSPTLRGRTCALSFAFASVSFAYYALAFGAGKLSSALLLNFSLLALVDVPGVIGSLGLTSLLGSTSSAAAILYAAGGALLLLLSTDQLTIRILPAPLLTALALAGKAIIAGAFALTYALTVDRFPGTLSGSALGLGSASGRISAMLVPRLAQTLDLPRLEAICGAVALASAFAIACGFGF
jgi:MFS family permease